MDRASAWAREDAVVDRARGDPHAFAALYEDYRGPIFHYCLRHLRCREDAEDATSEVFAKALAALARYRNGSFRGWLFTIARNVVVDATRRRRYHQNVAEIAHPADPGPTPEELALRAEERRWVRAMLDQLSRGEQATLALRAGGFSTAETVGALGRSPAAIKQITFRATARLRCHVRPSDNESEGSNR